MSLQKLEKIETNLKIILLFFPLFASCYTTKIITIISTQIKQFSYNEIGF